MNWQERADAVEARLHDAFAASLAGERPAYDRFLRELAPLLRAFFRRRLFDAEHEVEDLLQETLLAVHVQRHTYQVGRPVTAWVHAIARYKLMDLLRGHYRRGARHDTLDDHLELVAGSDHQALEARHDLQVLLNSVPPRYRQALWMTKIEGASVAEASAATGLSEGAVKVGVHRSLRALAARFGGGA